VSGQLHASAALTLGRNHWTGGCLGHKAGLDAVVKRINPIIDPAQNGTPVTQPKA